MRYDLILTDYNMPTLSGLEFARFVRTSRPDLPVILISGLIDEDLQSAARAAGINDVLPKPFSLNVFCEAVDRIMQQASTDR